MKGIEPRTDKVNLPLLFIFWEKQTATRNDVKVPPPTIGGGIAEGKTDVNNL